MTLSQRIAALPVAKSEALRISQQTAARVVVYLSK